MMAEYKCQCTYDSGRTRSWTAAWSIVDLNDGFTELKITGRGSAYHIILGGYSSGNFLCIPDIGLGCPLAHWSDIFWNTERISMFLNKTDAVTIATGIYEYWNS